MFGGGWKQHYREAVDKEEMVRRIEKVLGIPGSRIFECYGAAEHPILYVVEGVLFCKIDNRLGVNDEDIDIDDDLPFNRKHVVIIGYRG